MEGIKLSDPAYGWQILGASLARQGFEEFFYIMGGPISDAASAAMGFGVRGIDTRHETAAVMAAHATTRLRRRPAVCLAASGPGSANLAPGLANAMVDGAPVIAIGGASPVGEAHLGAFQEFDQIGMMRPIVKHAECILDARRIPERLAQAARIAMTGRPGPVYLEVPGDVLYASVADVPDLGDRVDRWPTPGPASASDVAAVMALLEQASRPLLLVGSGVLWSDAGGALRSFAEAAGVPVYTTPQARGALPEDHALSFPGARTVAMREADLLIVVGTRMNYVWSHFGPARFRGSPRIVQIDADPAQIGTARPVDLAIVGDARQVLEQLHAAASAATTGSAGRFRDWHERLAARDSERRAGITIPATSDGSLHPLTLCHALRDLLDRDDVLVVDGQDILAFARQSIPIHRLGHSLNSGTFGTMGVGVPYGIGARLASPAGRVVVLTGDGALGFSFMELDTAARHRLDITVVVSLNGGHTADPEQVKPGRNLGYTRYHDMAAALGWHAEYVDTESALVPALRRALDHPGPALVNVVTDWRAKASRSSFTSYET